MKIKPKKLEDLINESIKEVGSTSWLEANAFAIYEDTRVQVQVIVTKNEDDFHDELLPEYVEAEE